MYWNMWIPRVKSCFNFLLFPCKIGLSLVNLIFCNFIKFKLYWFKYNFLTWFIDKIFWLKKLALYRRDFLKSHFLKFFLPSIYSKIKSYFFVFLLYNAKKNNLFRCFYTFQKTLKPKTATTPKPTIKNLFSFILFQSFYYSSTTATATENILYKPKPKTQKPTLKQNPKQNHKKIKISIDNSIKQCYHTTMLNKTTENNR